LEKEEKNGDVPHTLVAEEVTMKEEDKGKEIVKDSVLGKRIRRTQKLKQQVYEFEVLNICILDQNTALKNKNGELIMMLFELKIQVRKWKFHVTHLRVHVKKLAKSIRKARVKKVKAEGSGINIQI